MTVAAAPSELDEAIAVVATAVREGRTLSALQREPIMRVLAHSTDQFGRSVLRNVIEQMDAAQSRAVQAELDPTKIVAEAARRDEERRRSRIERWNALSPLERALYTVADEVGGTLGRVLGRLAWLVGHLSTASSAPPASFEPIPRGGP